jgi:cytochrome c oxidase subunit 3
VGIIGVLTEKPWLNPGLDEALEARRDAAARAQPPAATGLMVYMGVMTVIFLMLITVYVLRMGNYGVEVDQSAGDAVPAWSLWALCGITPASDWKAMPEPLLLYINTLVLIVSSVVWQWARNVTVRGNDAMMQKLLVVGGVLGLLFVAGQLIAWQQLTASGFELNSNPANAFFYVLTAIHGAHMLGGIYVWARTVGRLVRGANSETVKHSVELNAVYWHYLLMIWLVMFALLVLT